MLVSFTNQMTKYVAHCEVLKEGHGSAALRIQSARRTCLKGVGIYRLQVGVGLLLHC
ncbi:MAG: hypothetical protein ACYTFM_10155 [Planctomycetota bacterium]